MSELTEFLLARIAEEEAWIERGRALSGGAILWEEETIVQATRECEAKRQIIEFHEQWPVLVETPPKMEVVESADPNSIAMRASQQIQWMTQQEYRARFGVEPPTTPVLRALAAVYADHPDFDEAWRSTSEI